MSGPRSPQPLPDGLAPVVSFLVRAAEEQAAGIRADGRARARASLAAAEEEAAAGLAEARLAGFRAAARVATGRRTAARRRARQDVLEARREAVANLRASALAGLAARLTSAEGQSLTRYLASLVEEKAGAPASIDATGVGGWQAVARSATGSAVIDLGMVVDQVLALHSDEVEKLWS